MLRDERNSSRNYNSRGLFSRVLVLYAARRYQGFTVAQCIVLISNLLINRENI